MTAGMISYTQRADYTLVRINDTCPIDLVFTDCQYEIGRVLGHFPGGPANHDTIGRKLLRTTNLCTGAIYDPVRGVFEHCQGSSDSCRVFTKIS